MTDPRKMIAPIELMEDEFVVIECYPDMTEEEAAEAVAKAEDAAESGMFHVFREVARQ